MQMPRRFDAQALGHGLARVATPFLTRQLFYGAAISCVVGLGLGLWLEPPRPRLTKPGSMQPLPINFQPQQQDQGAVVDVSPAPLPYEAPETRQEPGAPTDDADASPEVSPPAPTPSMGPPVRLEDADPADAPDGDPPAIRADPRWYEDQERERDRRSWLEDRYRGRPDDLDEPAPPRWAQGWDDDPARGPRDGDDQG